MSSPARLSPRERVLRAIEHQHVDRLPCYFAAEEDVWARLMAHLGAKSPVEVIQHFGADTIQVTQNRAEPELSSVTTVEDVERLRWPGPEDVDVQAYVGRAEKARATGLAVMGGAWATIFTGPRRQMGEAKFLMAMVDQPEMIARLVEKTTDSYLAVNDALFSRCADCLDIFYFGSDFGTQESLFISPGSFRRFFKPHLKRLVEHAKGFGLKVMYHTCGAVSEIIPDLIACGVDVLDPVQVMAHGMSPQSLAARFKGKIAFRGGISTQTTLPQCTSEQVAAVARETIAALGPLGYIVGPDQDLMADVPIENIESLYHAVRAYRV